MRQPGLPRDYILLVLLGLTLGAGCGSVNAPPSIDEQALEVTLHQSVPPTGFMVQVTNTGRVPLAICPCIGPPTRFVVFDLYYEEQDRDIGFPEILYSGGRLRRFFHCLEPGESLRVPVDFRKWEPIWDQQREPFPPFNRIVGPGAYRVRAHYIDTGEVGRRSCTGFRGRATSDWVSFETAE